MNENDELDLIVAEVRRAREAYAARFNVDLCAIFEDLRHREEESRLAGRKVVSLPPKRPEGWEPPITKKAS